MKLYLVRHGQSANNAIWLGTDHVDGRSSDPEITDIGHRQAALVGDHLAQSGNEPRQHPFIKNSPPDFGLTHVYCSLMTRSILTAEYIASRCNLPLLVVPDIFEQSGIYELDSAGVMQGLPGPGRDYFESRFPDVVLPKCVDENGWWNRPAETTGEFLARVKRIIGNIRREHADSDDCVAMIVHGDFMDQFINELMGVQRHQHNYQNDWVANWTFHNTSISRIDFVNGSHTVVYLNRIDHLPVDLITW